MRFKNFIENFREQSPGGKIRYQLAAWILVFAIGYIAGGLIP